MSEYLIKRTDGEWFDLRGRLAEALRPSSFASERVTGWGDWRIHTNGVEISFSYEDPGIQVVFEDDLPRDVADQIAEEAELPLDKEPFHWSEFDAFLEYAAP